jgi:small conductance mechanosensitive channel
MDIQSFLTNNLDLLVRLGLLGLFLIIGLRLVTLLKRSLLKRVKVMENDPGRQARLNTLVETAASTLRIIILAVAVFTILGMVGIYLGPLIASVGVAGLAISLGAQTLIKDVIGGTIILLENQFVVGEEITFGAITGNVEKISMRSTWLRDMNGKIHMISNGDVRLVSNASRDWRLAQVDLNLPFDTDLSAAVAALQEAMQRAAKDEALMAYLQEIPVVQGWNSLNEWSVQIRLSARAKPDQRANAEVELRRYALDSLLEVGIPLALPGRRVSMAD